MADPNEPTPEPDATDASPEDSTASTPSEATRTEPVPVTPPPEAPSEEAAPPPPPPAAAPAPARTRAADRGGLSPLALVAVVGVVVVIAATFAPWIGNGGGGIVSGSNVEKSGWNLFTDGSGGGSVRLYVENSFAKDAPFFGGLSTVVAAAVLGLMLLLALGTGSALSRLLAIAATVLLVGICFMNLASYLRADDSNTVGLKWGLVIVWIGALLSAAAIPAVLRRSD